MLLVQLKQDKLINQEEFLKGLNDALAGKAKAEDIDEAKIFVPSIIFPNEENNLLT